MTLLELLGVHVHYFYLPISSIVYTIYKVILSMIPYY